MGLKSCLPRNVVIPVIFGVLLLAAPGTRGNPAVFPVEMGETIPVPRVASGIFLRAGNDPASPIWSRLPRYRVTLQPAPAMHQSVSLRSKGTPDSHVLDLHAAHDGERLYIALSWRDPSRDETNAYDRFADAAAVQFALRGDEETSYMMGTPESPVNIWFWQAGTRVAQNLAAGGFGSTTRLPVQDVTVASSYDAGPGRWRVVFSRALHQGDDEFRADLHGKRPVMLALALWQGADAQRDGHKLTTPGWVRLALGE